MDEVILPYACKIPHRVVDRRNELQYRRSSLPILDCVRNNYTVCMFAYCTYYFVKPLTVFLAVLLFVLHIRMMVDSAVYWIEEELRFAKSKSRNSECSWGRQVVLAIAKNDSVGLLKIFNHEDRKSSISVTHKNLPNIDEQCTITGYADYMWTPLIHKFVGDTAIHLACKQGRETCVSVLLLLGADCNITNKNGESAHILSLKYLNKSIENIEFDSLRNFFSNTHPMFHEICPLALYR